MMREYNIFDARDLSIINMTVYDDRAYYTSTRLGLAIIRITRQEAAKVLRAARRAYPIIIIERI